MNPFMIAVEKGHLEVVKAMMKKDPGLMSLQVGSGTTVIHWALEEGQHRSTFFKVRTLFFISLYTLYHHTSASKPEEVAYLVIHISVTNNNRVFI